ncbi:MAG: hypothetical protein QXQ02_04480, partial [Halobacteria archaeon]
ANNCIAAAGTLSYDLFIFNLNGVQLWSFKANSDVTGIAMTPSADYIAVSSRDRIVRLFKGESTLIWSTNFDSPVNAIAISPDGKVISVGCDDTYVYLFINGNPAGKFKARQAVTGVAITQNGEYIAASSKDTYVYLIKGFGEAATPIQTPSETPVQTVTPTQTPGVKANGFELILLVVALIVTYGKARY